MSTDALHMLKRLEPVVRPGQAIAFSAELPLEQAGFEDLLARAERGEFESGRRIDHAAGIDPLTDEMNSRIAKVADAAEAAGFNRVLVIADDRPMLLEVRDRKIEKELVAVDQERLYSVDAAVRVLSEKEMTEAVEGIGSPVHHPAQAQPPAAIAEAILEKNTTSQGNRDEAA